MFAFVARAMSGIALAAGVALLAGCPSGSPTPPANGTNAKPPTTEPESVVKTRAVADLAVKVGEYSPPLDEGKIEIAAPENWHVGPQQIGYVAWFHREADSKKLPQIRIAVEPSPPDAPPDVNADNVEEFAQWLSGHVKKSLKHESELVEPVIPMIVGDNAVGRYVRRGRYRDKDAEQHILVTSQGGRLYTLQQLVLAGDLAKRDIRDAAYAVVGSMKFPAAATPPTDAPSAEPAAETPPAP